MKSIVIDLHPTMFMVCTLEEEKEEFHKYNIKEIENFSQTLKREDEIAIEATGNSHYFANQIKDRVSRVVLVNPSKFKVISDSINKIDKNDSRNLALFLQKNLLPEVRMSDEYTVQLKSLANIRSIFVKERTAVMNKIHGLLNYHGITS